MAARDAALTVELEPHQNVAAEGFGKLLSPSQDSQSCRDRCFDRATGAAARICSISDRLCSTSRMRIQTRALTSPASSTGTSNDELS